MQRYRRKHSADGVFECQSESEGDFVRHAEHAQEGDRARKGSFIELGYQSKPRLAYFSRALRGTHQWPYPPNCDVDTTN
jgi:hypothetical protein